MTSPELGRLFANFLTICAGVNVVIFFFAVGKFGADGINKGAYVLTLLSPCWLMARYL